MKKIAFTDFRTWTRDRFIDAQTRRSVRLAPTYLIAHESGVEGGMHDTLSAAEWSRVGFHLYSGEVKGAELLFYVNAYEGTRDTPMQVLVNGHALTHRQDREKMLTGGWDRKRINTRYLQEGNNEFIFSHHGRLNYDPHPGGHADVRVSHSERSFDGGKSWHDDALGLDRDTRGEYLVRLRVKGHPPEGLLTSPTIDVADPDGNGCIAPQMGLRRLDLAVQADIPAGTSIEFEMRSGSTPAFDPRAWTAWSTTTRLEWPGRFVQFRALLRTDSSDVTPILKGVTLDVESKENAKSVAGMKLVEIDHPELAYSSYPFTYLAPHARLDRLRKQHRLDDVIAEGTTELEQLALLRDWVHSQWLGWQSQKYPYCPPWDPLEILETTKGDWGFWYVHTLWSHLCRLCKRTGLGGTCADCRSPLSG